MNLIVHTVLVGLGATMTMDIYAFILKLFGIPSLDYRFLGRWVGHFPKGKFFHSRIFESQPIPGELFLGYAAHYFIGITFAFVLVATYGKDWLENPAFFPAIVIGLVTVAAPFFMMQPAFGFGIAGSDLPDPNVARFKSLITHFIYGLGLYLSAIAINKLIELVK